MSMVRFAAATMVAALILIWADGYGGEWLLAWTSPPATHFIYRTFAWACMCAAVFLVTPAPRNSPNIIVCGLVLSIAFIFAREVPLYSLTASSPHVHTLTALAVFALLMGTTGLWYRGLKPR